MQLPVRVPRSVDTQIAGFELSDTMQSRKHTCRSTLTEAHGTNPCPMHHPYRKSGFRSPGAVEAEAVTGAVVSRPPCPDRTHGAYQALTTGSTHHLHFRFRKGLRQNTAEYTLRFAFHVFLQIVIDRCSTTTRCTSPMSLQANHSRTISASTDMTTTSVFPAYTSTHRHAHSTPSHSSTALSHPYTSNPMPSLGPGHGSIPDSEQAGSTRFEQRLRQAVHRHFFVHSPHMRVDGGHSDPDQFRGLRKRISLVG